MHNRYFRRRWLLPALLALPLAARAQTGVTIGATTAPDASAALDIVSSSKGLLLPRLTAAARLGIASPAAGLLVYQTNAPTTGAGSGTTPGFYYNAGTATAARWQRLTDNNGVSYDPATGLQVGPTTPTTTTLSPYNALGGNESPFNGGNNSRRVASYIPASVLLGAGVNPNLLLTALGVTVITKASTAPFTNFTLQLANAPSNPVGSTTDGGLVMTTVYTGTISTVAGLNTISFTTPFKWDGVSGLYVQSCFVNTAAVGADVIQATGAGANSTQWVAGAAVCGTSYTLSSSAIPLLTLTQGGAYTLPAGAGQPGQVLTQQAGGAVGFQNPQWTQSGAALYPSTPGSSVGIGTTTPNARLSITPTLTEPKLTLFDGGSTTGHYGLGVSSGQLNYHVLTGSDRHVFYATGRNGDGTELMRIQGDGNVGIGTNGAAPSARLDVRGGLLAAGSNGVGAQGAHLQWNRSGGDGETWLINNLGLGNATTSGIRFGGATTGSTTTVTEWARFLTNGNLGLGTTTPGARLEVAGQVKITGGAPGPGKVLTSDGSGLATWESVAGAAATNFVQNQTAAAQAASFRIGGSGRIDGENQGLLVDAGGAARVGLMKYAGHEAGLWRATGQDFEIGRTDVSDLTTTPSTFTTDLYVDGAGNVGIGTGTAAAARLHVAGTAGTSNVRLESLGGTGTRLVTTDASGNLGSSTSTVAFGNEFIRNSGTAQAGAVFNIGGGGVVGGSLTANGGLNVTGTTFINNTGTGTTMVGNSSSGAVSVTGSSVSLVSGLTNLSLSSGTNSLNGSANNISFLTPGGGTLNLASTGVYLGSPSGNLVIGPGNTVALGNVNGMLNINGTSMSLSSARGMLNIGNTWSASSQGAMSFISNAGTSFYSSGAFDILSTGGFTLNSSNGTTITAGPNSLTVLNNGVGVGTATPTSTLHTTGTVAVGVTNGLAGSPSPGVALTATAYNGLAPSGASSYYQLPAASSCTGRVYYLRNNSTTDTATLTTAGGQFFDGGGSTGVSTYGLNTSGSSKTVTVISDGTNWTVLRSGN